MHHQIINQARIGSSEGSWQCHYIECDSIKFHNKFMARIHIPQWGKGSVCQL